MPTQATAPTLPRLASVATLVVRYQALSSRERLLLAVATLVVSYFAVEWLLLTPQLEQRAALAARAQDRQVERNALQTVLQTAAPGARLPRSSAQTQHDALQATVRQGEELVREARNPQALAPLLRTLVATTPGLQLTALRSAPATLFYQPPTATPPAGAQAPNPASGTATLPSTPAPAPPAVDLPTLYVKTLDVSVTGNYLDLLRYLQALQDAPHTLYWDSASVAVGAYPAASMQLVLKVLTTEPDTPGTPSTPSTAAP